MYRQIRELIEASPTGRVAVVGATGSVGSRRGARDAVAGRFDRIGAGAGRAFACLAETMLLSLAGHRGHFGLGRPTLDQVDRMVELAEIAGAQGFRPAAPTSFGRPVTLQVATAELVGVAE